MGFGEVVIVLAAIAAVVVVVSVWMALRSFRAQTQVVEKSIDAGRDIWKTAATVKTRIEDKKGGG